MKKRKIWNKFLSGIFVVAMIFPNTSNMAYAINDNQEEIIVTAAEETVASTEHNYMSDEEAPTSEEPVLNENGQYEIGSLEQLMWFASKVNTQEITSHKVILTGDIVIDDSVEWKPIMLKDNCPSVFDGNGHTITINQDLTSLGNQGIGIFGTYNYSTIKNLIVKGEIKCNSQNVGAIVGSAYRTTISNVISYVNITNAATEGGTGGLAGKFGGQDADGLYSLIENCTVNANISGGGSAGGLVGNIWAGYQYCTIKDSHYSGDVNGTVNSGAIVGYNGNNSATTSTIKNVSYDEKDNIHFIGGKGSGKLSTENISIKPAKNVTLRGKTYEIKDGLILDLRELVGPGFNVTINITGSGQVISTGQYRLENSVINVTSNNTSDYVLLQNVRIICTSADKFNETGLHISGDIINVEVEGCEITNRVDERREVYDIVLHTYYDDTPRIRAEFQIIGSTGKTEWLYLKTSEGSLESNCVGEIQSIKFRLKDGDYYEELEDISVKGRNYGSTYKAYIGRMFDSDTDTGPITVKNTDNVYRVEVHTAFEPFADTWDTVYFYLRDTSGRVSDTWVLNYGPTLPNQSIIKYVYVPDDFGECVNVVFYTERRYYSANAWKLDDFTISKEQGESTNEYFKFDSGQYFEENDYPISFGKYSGQTGAFYVEVKTSNKSKAGTDSNIWLTIYGSKGSTGEINLGTYAAGGNDFEKNDLDCFYIGYNVAKLGTIEKIKIRKEDNGIGPDWHLDYIKISEEVGYEQEGQSVTFDIDQWIRDSSYTFGSGYITNVTLRATTTIDRELLSNLTKNDDGSYSLKVDRNITMKEDVFDLLTENGLVFTVEMMDDSGEMIYAITFDGSKFESSKSLELKKGYSFTDGNAIVDFLSNVALPAGTTIRINAKFLGFDTKDTFVELTRSTDEKWKDSVMIKTGSETKTITLKEGIEKLVNSLSEELPLINMTEDTAAPPTGDKSNLWMWLVLLFISGIGVSRITLYERKRKMQK